MLAVNGDGIPLGVPHIQYEAPDGAAEKDKPPEERKTWRWVRGLQDCDRLSRQLDGVRPVSIADREDDLFELFVEQRRLGTVDLLVLAKHNRSLGRKTPKLVDTAQEQPVRKRLEIHVARSSARRGTRRQKGPGSGMRARRLSNCGGVRSTCRRRRRAASGTRRPNTQGPVALSVMQTITATVATALNGAT